MPCHGASGSLWNYRWISVALWRCITEWVVPCDTFCSAILHDLNKKHILHFGSCIPPSSGNITTPCRDVFFSSEKQLLASSCPSTCTSAYVCLSVCLSDNSIGHVTWRPTEVHTVDSMKYFQVRQQCKGNPFLRFHGKTHRFHTVDSYMQVNNINGRHYCISMATMVAWTFHNTMLYVNCPSF